MVEDCVEEWGENKNFGFNPQVKYADQFLAPRISYITEVIRQLAEVSQARGTVAVVDHDLVPFIEQAWQKELTRDLKPLRTL